MFTARKIRLDELPETRRLFSLAFEFPFPEGADIPSVRRAYEDYSQKFREIALFFNRQMQGAWDDLHSSEPSESGRPDERGATSRLVIESALIAGFSKILAEKLIRLCDADVEAVLAAEQAKQNE